MAKNNKLVDVLLVDGYNIIHAWPQLRYLVDHVSLDAARDKLIEIMGDYKGSSGERIVVVFDAYHTKRIGYTREQMFGVEVVYTRRGETADHYIERMISSLDPKSVGLVRVATSDSTEQTVVMGRGGIRVSAHELLGYVRQTAKHREHIAQKQQGIKPNTLENSLPSDVREKLLRMIREDYKD